MKCFVFISVLCVYATAFAAKSALPQMSQYNNAVKMTALKSTKSAEASTNTRGDASVAATTFNIAKSIIGAGVLSLPSGVAFFADSPVALIPATVMCVTMGLVAAYSYSLIGKACEQHNAKTLQEVWEKSVNPKTAWIVSGGITSMCFFAALAYSIIIGDSFSSIAASFNLPAVFAQRTNLILLLTTFVLFPLCSLKSLSALAPFSLLGLLGTSYTAVFMAMRYFDGSYAPGGAFFKTLSATFTPKFGSKAAVSTKAFVLLSMLSSSYVAHFNAPQFYSELKDTSVPKFSGVVNTAFGFAILKYAFMTAIGFLTFGGASSGFVLNNYASTDGLASIARLAIGVALITSYPFTFAALRNGVMDLGKFSPEKRAKWTKPLTIGLLGLLTSLAIVLKDVGFVVSIAGAVFGNAIMFIVPAMMNLSNSKKAIVTKSGVQVGRISQLEAIFNKFMIAAGVLMAVIGAVISTLRQFGGL